MMHRLTNVTKTFGVALGAGFAALLLWTASAGAATCVGFFCPPPTHTTTTTTSSSSSTVTSTATSTTSTATDPPPAGLPSATLIPATSGTHGFAYDAVPPPSGVPGAPALTTASLAAAGYVEQEYQLSGTAKEYAESGSWGTNGDWNVKANGTAPYTTRIIVRYPTNPAQFNGTVVFEWLNDTTGGDQDPVWAQINSELISHGFAYVGVTAQESGMSDLATWDPARYGSLGDSSDAESYDIFTQAAEVVKDDPAILGGLTTKVEIGTGDSQSAFRIDTYVNAIQPLTHAFNAFLGVGRAVVAAPIGNGLISLTPWPALIRTNNTAPFIELNTQGDVLELQSALARQPDNTDLRTWEVAGAAHIDAHEGAYETETIAREQPTAAIPMCVGGTPIEGTGTALDGINQPDNMPLWEVEEAAVAALQNWVVNGVPAPKESSYLSTTSILGLLDVPNVNKYGVASGGIQLPESTVPTENYSVINLSNIDASEFQLGNLISEAEAAIQTFETGSISNPTLRSAGLCLLSGYFTDLGNSTLQSLYPSAAAYASKYDAAANSVEAAGFITPADAAAAEANANADIGNFQQPEVSIP